MTCIVGVRTKKKVILGGDSLGTSSWSKWERNDPKVFKPERNVVMGFTTSFRMGQILQHRLDMPPVPKGVDEFEWMVVEFVPHLIKVFTENNWIKTPNERVEGGDFIVGINNKLFAVESDFQIHEGLNDYLAIGCGESFAEGCLFGNSHMKARDRVVQALDAASHHSAGVGGHYTIEET